ncbi:MAG: hypothetical protein V1893_01590, partial [Candidatus Omnitrophota bacterium]
KYSSYNYYAYGQKDDLLDIDPVYEDMASTEKGRQEAYRNLMLDEKLDITEKTFKQLFFGTDDFICTMERRFSVKNTRLNVGRPKGK